MIHERHTIYEDDKIKFGYDETSKTSYFYYKFNCNDNWVYVEYADKIITDIEFLVPIFKSICERLEKYLFAKGFRKGTQNGIEIVEKRFNKLFSKEW